MKSRKLSWLMPNKGRRRKVSVREGHSAHLTFGTRLGGQAAPLFSAGHHKIQQTLKAGGAVGDYDTQTCRR